jgi:hypothetical protein
MNPDLILPDGRYLQEAVNYVYRKIPYDEKMTTLREFKRTERKLGLSRDHARYYVLSGGKMPPVPEEEEVLVPTGPEPGQRDDLNASRSEMEYVARGLSIDFPRDSRKPHLWELIGFLRASKVARDYFWMRYMDAVSDPRGHFRDKKGSQSSDVSLDDVVNRSG